MTTETMEKKRTLRALPPPPDWPDGDEAAVWREDLGCGLCSVVALLPEHQVQLMLSEGAVTDMRGALALALDIDPHVEIVVTYSGDQMDTIYMRTGGAWEIRDARVRP